MSTQTEPEPSAGAPEPVSFDQWWQRRKADPVIGAWLDDITRRELAQQAWNVSRAVARSAHERQAAERIAALDGPSLQDRVRAWCVACFGPTTADDVTERNWRFLEEALELVQSLGGNVEDAHRLIDYVFGRPVGEPAQEVGGTMITLSALCTANDLDMLGEGEREYQRIVQPAVIEKIRKKHAGKPHRSPLPGDYRYGEPERHAARCQAAPEGESDDR
jgi:hypothetical protein